MAGKLIQALVLS
ncbi:uncharacterized protein FFNC_15710 [Fusarium fujikuroi]|nr:uncharacterized protein FFNC_15710 [Fusarium fujikuroi]